MKTSFVLTLGVSILLFSCKDAGEVVEYLEVTSLNPAPNSSDVDKSTVIGIGLNRPIPLSQAGKIQLRYVNDTSSINYYAGCGLTPAEVDQFCIGPFIWKPGRIVEVIIPQDLSDPEGRTLRQSIVYRFSIAEDSVPFQLLNSQPQNGDTISLGSSPWWFGSLTFSDYLFLRDSVLTIEPPAEIHVTTSTVIIDGRNIPFRTAYFVVHDFHPGVTYTITVPREITDYEGEMLPQDYQIVFHTRP